MRLATMLTIIPLAFIAVACGNPSAKWVGTYQGKLRATALNLPDGSNPHERTVSMELREDNTFTQNLTPMMIEGKWHISGTQLITTPTRVSIDGSVIPTKLSKTMYNPVTFKLEGEKITLRREGEEHIYTRQ